MAETTSAPPDIMALLTRYPALFPRCIVLPQAPIRIGQNPYKGILAESASDVKYFLQKKSWIDEIVLLISILGTGYNDYNDYNG
jgi:hypothetical protein